jgi:prefoldin subunit 5
MRKIRIIHSYPPVPAQQAENHPNGSTEILELKQQLSSLQEDLKELLTSITSTKTTEGHISPAAKAQSVANLEQMKFMKEWTEQVLIPCIMWAR